MSQHFLNFRSMMIFSLIAITVISSIFFVFPESIKVQSEEKVFVTHTGAIVKTTGETAQVHFRNRKVV